MNSCGIIQDLGGNVWFEFRDAIMKHGAVSAECDIVAAPARALTLLKELEGHVSRQEFSCIDEMITQIETYHLEVLWRGSTTTEPIYDVQLVADRISFRLKQA